MEFVPTSFLLSLMMAYAAGLQCYSCDGDSDCHETEDCEEHQEQCSTTVMTILARSKISNHFLKGCDVSGKPNNSISHLSGSHVVFLTEEHCETNLCNQGGPDVLEVLTARATRRNVLQCYSCTSTDQTCAAMKLQTMRCARLEENCVDITSFTTLEEFPADEQRIKGCGLLSHCEESLGFHNHKSFYFIKCCNRSHCNNDMEDYKNDPMPPNGVTCYSCEGNSTHGCSERDITELQCQGPMTQCLVASGVHGLTGQSLVVKGCASPSWCDSPYTSVYKNLGERYSHCCSGNLCNSQIINDLEKPSFRSHASHKVSAHQTLLSIIVLLSINFLLSTENS